MTPGQVRIVPIHRRAKAFRFVTQYDAPEQLEAAFEKTPATVEKINPINIRIDGLTGTERLVLAKYLRDGITGKSAVSIALREIAEAFER